MNRLWVAQIRGVLRLEMRKNLFSARALPMYLLAVLPLAVTAIFILVTTVTGIPPEIQGAAGAATFYAGLYRFILMLLYFGCVWIFMNLFRGEVMDRSLHYYFLTPIRREALVVSKYVSAWFTTALLFCASSTICFVALYGYLGGSGTGGVMRGTSLAHLAGYLGATLLGCLGYGAVFLLGGLFFRNPIVPALVVLGVESINPFLPVLLKKISVIFYVNSLLPVPLEDGPFAIMAEPTSAWLSIPGLILFAGLTMLVAALRIRRMEISYAGD
jgi:ABC-type transport system involved in multi-copper enzyme maturation permease subunit